MNIDTNDLCLALGEIQDSIDDAWFYDKYPSAKRTRWDRALDAAVDIITKSEALAVSVTVGCKDLEVG